MKIISTIKKMQEIAEDLRKNGKTIAVVPTMGYLHAGHLSLVEIVKHRADIIIMTIFVNPAQFGPNEDFTKYPRDIERDTKSAEAAGADYLFIPAMEEMYPKDYFTYVNVEELTTVLEGKFRPTHFKGVATVVAKLLNITQPHVAVFGQKDAQQAVVIRRMVKDLNFPVEIVIAPIIREDDGLAMSSRNVYLSPVERDESVVLNRSLKHAETMIKAGERRSDAIIKEMQSMILGARSAVIDYIAITDPQTLHEIPHIQSKGSVLISMAVRIGKTRLIDNILINIS
ncbi:MAG: pantoate--beta-alanine ligase [Bacteroidota bacterium]